MILSYSIIRRTRTHMSKTITKRDSETVARIISEVIAQGETSASKKKAAIKLGCSSKTIKRKIKDYKEHGKSGLIHKNRGRPPSTKIDDSTRQKVIDYYVQNYPDANISHYKDIIKEDFDIDISEETLRLWFLDNNILSPKSHKKTKRAVA